MLVEQPGYPNGLDVLRDLGARPVPVPVTADGWDRTALEAAARQTAPRAAYLTPDFQNPSGALMDDATRQQVATTLARHGVPVVVDESLVEPAPRRPARGAPPVRRARPARRRGDHGGLGVEGVLGRPAHRLAARGCRDHDPAGRPAHPRRPGRAGARAGWRSRTCCARLDDVLLHHRDGLRARRALLQQALADHLPSWRYATPPGGSVLWCALPAPVASHVSVAADALGVRVTPGSRFAVDGTLESWMRLPYTRPADEPAPRRPARGAGVRAGDRAAAAARRPAPEQFVVYSTPARGRRAGRHRPRCRPRAAPGRSAPRAASPRRWRASSGRGAR
ncbi:hypothetical protein GCM10025868_13970 [Angustibacter aerolatus]|uniref:Aminotransferase class I/classII large domain-containing protein n=1 Tax=Angustibacter aerolatus TaxID=1162965 RepID=A0ABQ6JGV8_9ACTN|nr:hypothetical protein GCM10025868_13970 [Angustibacter aerolatus]